MRIAIIGRTATLLESAQRLVDAGHRIAMVITSRPSPEQDDSEEDFRALAAAHGAVFLSTPTLEREMLSAGGAIDVGVSLNFPTVIGQPAIDAFALGILNAHGGDLPRYRGNACQAWALLQGETRIGLCIHRMVGNDVDAGDIVLRRYLDVTIDTRVGEVMAWMQREVPALFVEAVRQLQRPQAVFERQDPAAALRCYPRRPEDGRIDWRADQATILRLINASSEPFGGAFTSYRGERMVVWRAALVADGERYLAVAGQVARIDRAGGTVDVITGAGKLRLLEVELDGMRSTPDRVIKSARERLI